MDLLQFLIVPNNLMILAVAVVSGVMLMLPSLNRSRQAGLTSGAAIQMANRQQGVWVDVRPAEQFQAGHIAQARSLPVADIDQKAAALPKNKPLIVVCESGRDAAKVAAKLKAQGFGDVHVLEGGMRAWSQASLPVTKKVETGRQVAR